MRNGQGWSWLRLLLVSLCFFHNGNGESEEMGVAIDADLQLLKPFPDYQVFIDEAPICDTPADPTDRRTPVSTPTTDDDGLHLKVHHRHRRVSFPLTKEQIRTLYTGSEDEILVGVDADWTGNLDTCKSGTVSDVWRAVSVKRINMFRQMAHQDLQIVSLGADSLSKKGQAGAIIISANGVDCFNHDPSVDCSCFSEEGRTSAATSNIAIGVWGARAIDGYFNEPGSTNAAVGHRRWKLYPRLKLVGVADTGIKEGTLEVGAVANHIKVFGDEVWHTATEIPANDMPEFIAWPPNGYIPFQLVPESRRWSVSRPHGVYFSDDAVVTIDGDVSVIEHKENDSRMPTIVFEGPDSAFSALDDVHYNVVVVEDGVVSLNYTVSVFDPNPPQGATCTTATLSATGNVVSLAGVYEKQDEMHKGRLVFKSNNGNYLSYSAYYTRWILYDSLEPKDTKGYCHSGHVDRIRVQDIPLAAWVCNGDDGAITSWAYSGCDINITTPINTTIDEVCERGGECCTQEGALLPAGTPCKEADVSIECFEIDEFVCNGQHESCPTKTTNLVDGTPCTGVAGGVCYGGECAHNNNKYCNDFFVDAGLPPLDGCSIDGFECVRACSPDSSVEAPVCVPLANLCEASTFKFSVDSLPAGCVYLNANTPCVVGGGSGGSGGGGGGDAIGFCTGDSGECVITEAPTMQGETLPPATVGTTSSPPTSTPTNISTKTDSTPLSSALVSDTEVFIIVGAALGVGLVCAVVVGCCVVCHRQRKNASNASKAARIVVPKAHSIKGLPPQGVNKPGTDPRFNDPRFAFQRHSRHSSGRGDTNNNNNTTTSNNSSKLARGSRRSIKVLPIDDIGGTSDTDARPPVSRQRSHSSVKTISVNNHTTTTTTAANNNSSYANSRDGSHSIQNQRSGGVQRLTREAVANIPHSQPHGYHKRGESISSGSTASISTIDTLTASTMNNKFSQSKVTPKRVVAPTSSTRTSSTQVRSARHPVETFA